MKQEVTIFWFRRDLRMEDNAGLYHALKENKNILPVFIFDTSILDALEDKQDRRVDFIHQAITELHARLEKLDSGLQVMVGKPMEVFTQLLQQYAVKAVYTNHDYEPYAAQRDAEIQNLLQTHKAIFKTYKDQCIFEKNEVIKDDGTPYTVFTPYSNKWKKKLKPFFLKGYPVATYSSAFFKFTASPMPSLQNIGFQKTKIRFQKSATVSEDLLKNYKAQRDYPAQHGTSRLSMHLRFGTISIRQLVAKALPHSETWLNELIWRDFYMMILWHFPHVAHSAFKKDYSRIPWRSDPEAFERWCEGKTGFPIVDAGMRELNATGFMHNRVRMIVSSFLVKDLLIDWRLGEAYFAKKLNDFDLSANNGGWQWAAGTGCDAAPYFRIFNPAEQQKKFDPKLEYIKTWIPEFGTSAYPAPMVDHARARKHTLEVYKQALSEVRQTTLF